MEKKKMEIIEQLKQQAAKGLIIRVTDVRKISTGQSTEGSSLHIGDQIEFTMIAFNNNPFNLTNLTFHIHQMSAVELQENPIIIQVAKISEAEELQLSTFKGKIVENPNDVSSLWTIEDSLCRVKITGLIDLPPVPFEDIEVETLTVLDK